MSAGRLCREKEDMEDNYEKYAVAVIIVSTLRLATVKAMKQAEAP